MIGVAKTPGGPSEWVTFGRVFAALGRDVDRDVVVNYVDKPAEIESLLRRGAVDLAVLSPGIYIEAQRETSITIVAAPIVDGATANAALLVVRADSAAKSVEDLRGARLLVSPDSLAGRPFVEWLARGRGQTARKLFGSIIETGTQDQNLGAVIRGEADATAVGAAAFAGREAGRLRVIARSPSFGMSPIVARSGLPTRTADAVRRSLLDAAKSSSLPASSSITGFCLPNDAEFTFVRALEALKLSLAASREATP